MPELSHNMEEEARAFGKQVEERIGILPPTSMCLWAVKK